MAESCAYCGEEMVEGGVRENENVFCSQECLDAYNEEALLFAEEDERDDF